MWRHCTDMLVPCSQRNLAPMAKRSCQRALTKLFAFGSALMSTRFLGVASTGNKASLCMPSLSYARCQYSRIHCGHILVLSYFLSVPSGSNRKRYQQVQHQPRSHHLCTAYNLLAKLTSIDKPCMGPHGSVQRVCGKYHSSAAKQQR